MGRYIDADKILPYISRLFGGMPLAVLKIAETDSIDIVRCAECKYWRNADAEKIPTASIACGNMHADDFCSYGERG